jgi:hypothetical protein
MRAGRWAAALAASWCTVWGLAQLRERVSARYESEMQDPVDDPEDAAYQGEFSLGRLRYRSPLDGRRGGYFRWGIDANKGDRLFLGHLRRVTRVDISPVETVVNANSETMFDFPWMFAVSVGDWALTDAEAKQLRQYFDRGGFLMVDDFHNEREWARFMDGMRRIDPGVAVDELDSDDPAFHVVFTMKDRIRVPGANVAYGSGIERGGEVPHWRAIRDSRGRMMVAITFNMDVGDGWEFADVPEYPEQFSYEAIRLGVNYVVYAMTH